MTSTGVQVQATVVEATAGAHTSSAVADTGGKKVKRRRRQRKNDTTPSHVVMVITDETVEERKQRLSDEADRADKLARVQAEDQANDRRRRNGRRGCLQRATTSQASAGEARRQGCLQIGEVEARPLQVGWRG